MFQHQRLRYFLKGKKNSLCTVNSLGNVPFDASVLYYCPILCPCPGDGLADTVMRMKIMTLLMILILMMMLMMMILLMIAFIILSCVLLTRGRLANH